MSEDRPSSGSAQRSWFERLSQVLLGEPQDRQQLIALLRDAQQRNLLDADALGMIEGVLQVAEMRVRDIMIPRSQMVVVERDEEPGEFLPTVIESAHSRFPVIGENRDEVVGILLAKDLLSHLADAGSGAFRMRDLLRPAVFIPESKRLNVLLKEFRSSRNHIAIVVDEYGGVAGMVTIEDVLEQIVGDIEGEHEFGDDVFINRISDSEYTVKALIPIEDFNEAFGTDYDDSDYDTIGGMVMNRLGHMPRRGEVVTVGDWRYRVLRADNRRIHLLEVTRSTVPSDEEQASASPGG